MPGPSSWSLPVERRVEAISPRKARKNFFAFIFQLSGCALVAPSCFVLVYEDLIYVVFASRAPNYMHMHTLTVTDQGLRTRLPRVRGRA